MSLLYDVVDCENVFITHVPENPSEDGIFEQIVNNYNTPSTTSYLTRKYTIEYSMNCCEATMLDIPVNYQFSNYFTNYEMSGSPQTGNSNYTFTLQGISGAFVKSVSYRLDTISGVYSPLAIQKLNNGFIYSATYRNSDVTIPNTPGNPPPTGDKIIYLKITTIDDFEYLVRVTFTLSYPGLGNLTNIATYTEQIPNLPVSINSNYELDLNLLMEGDSDQELFTGVYNVIVCKWFKRTATLSDEILSTCVQGAHFVDCGLNCLIVDKLVKCPSTNAHHFYKMLQYSNDCETPYEHRCALYKNLIMKLTAPDCNDPYDDCDCKDCNNGGTAYPYNFSKGIDYVKTLYKGCKTCGSNRRR